jgi:predicted Zn finger-like uncharacterized protein
MIIECKYCARKFKVADSVLKPGGSTIRCSKCGKVFTPPVAEAASVSLVGADKREIRISGNVVHSTRNPAGKTKLGLSLAGAQTEIRLFPAKAAEAYRLNIMRPV